MRALRSLIVLALVARPASAQAGRRALAAGTEQYLLADYQRAAPLLGLGLDPGAGSLDKPWRLGVERLADVLLVLRQDSLAAAWLRWAFRLAPDFDVDVEVAPPAVVRAARAARAFVDSTPSDRFVARTEFEWPSAFRADAPGEFRLAVANVPITARIGVDQFLRGGESRRLSSGSYDVVVSAPGYLPTRLTVELLPGVTTVVHVSLLPETAGLLYVAARPWGAILVDGQRIGNTSVAAHRVAPGKHTLRFERNGGPAIDTTIVVAERQQGRLSWVTTRDPTGDSQIDSPLTMLDRGDTERGVELLRQLLSPPVNSFPPSVRASALARLAEATWPLGERDSAQAELRELVLVDPFYSPPTGLFNPDLQAAYGRVRRGTAAIGIRAPRDTVVTPLRDSLRIDIAVGQPGEVRLLLRLSSPRPHDSLLTAMVVDSVAHGSIPLSAPDGSVLAPGIYTVEGAVAASGRGASDLLQLSVERMPVDTTAYEPQVPDAATRPETRKRGPSLRSTGEGIGLGALVILLTATVNKSDVSGRSIPPAAWVIGGSVALANFAFKRPRVPIPENIRYNESRRAQWEADNGTIAAENARKLRLAPLRIRASRER